MRHELREQLPAAEPRAPRAPAATLLAAAGAPRRYDIALALQRTHGNRSVSRAVAQLRRAAVETPEADQTSYGLTTAQYLDVSTWLAVVARTRAQMDERRFAAAAGTLNELDDRMRGFEQRFVQKGEISLPAGQRLATALTASEEARAQVGALASTRRDNIREAYTALTAAAAALDGAARSSDKLSDAEKAVLSGYRGTLAAAGRRMEPMEADTATLQNVMDSTLPMVDALRDLGGHAPELQAPASEIDRANLVLQVLVHPKEGEQGARRLVNEIGAAIQGALALPLWRPDQPSRLADPPVLGPRTELRAI